MIIVLVKSGQMCNQLLTLASAISLGLEYGHDVYCPLIDLELKEIYKFKPYDGCKIKIITKRPWWAKSIEFLEKCAKKINFPIKGCSIEDIKKSCNEKKLLLLDWNLIDEEVVNKWLPELKKIIKFSDDIENNAYKILKKSIKKDRISVGVHIRRGDYAQFNSGIWFYSDGDYCKWMNQIQNQISNVDFYISSNENININNFNKINAPITLLNGSPVEDLCCLSKCKYIMGPPSTYSWWASIVGHSRRWTIIDKTETCNLDNFKYYEENLDNK